MEIKEVINGLSKPLKIEEIDWRVQSVKKTQKGVGMIVLGYKDARVDMKRLDEVTEGAWQDMYQRDSKGVLQCGIGVYCKMSDGGYQWVWKYSNGVESFAEAQKGEYSDAFKRTGFMWGIGRELYDLPFIWINLESNEHREYNGKIKNTLNPNDLNWSRSNGLLVCKDKNGKERFRERAGQSTQGKTNEEPKPTNTKGSAALKKLTDPVLNNIKENRSKDKKEDIDKDLLLKGYMALTDAQYNKVKGA